MVNEDNNSHEPSFVSAESQSPLQAELTGCVQMLLHKPTDGRPSSSLSRCWFSADTKQDRLDWMEKLSQALLDFHTWSRTSATQTESQQSHAESSGNLRESIL